MAGYDDAQDGDSFVGAATPQFTLSTGHRKSEEPQTTAKPPRKPDEYMVWKARDTQRQLWEERMVRVTEGIFETQRKAIAEAVDNQTTQTISVAVDNAITDEQWQPLRELYLATMLDAGQMTLDQLGFTRTRNTLQPDNFSLFREVFGLFFDQTITFAQVYSAELVQQVNETTKRQLREIITPRWNVATASRGLPLRLTICTLTRLSPTAPT
jgi:hypothetical protein